MDCGIRHSTLYKSASKFFSFRLLYVYAHFYSKDERIHNTRSFRLFKTIPEWGYVSTSDFFYTHVLLQNMKFIFYLFNWQIPWGICCCFYFLEERRKKVINHFLRLSYRLFPNKYGLVMKEYYNIFFILLGIFVFKQGYSFFRLC